LILASAISHAVWNFIAKDSGEKESFMMLLNLSSTVIFLPIFYFIIPSWSLPTDVLPFILVSGVAETVYFVALGKAYETGDLSIVYPLARSSPLFVAIAAAYLFNETITFRGFVGIILVIFGVFILHLKSFKYKDLIQPLKSLGEPGTFFAVIAAFGTTIYSLSDKKAVTIVNPFLYSLWRGIFVTTLLSGVVIYRKSMENIRKEVKGKQLRIIVSGFLMKAGYVLVLFTMSFVEVSYILSIRQFSVVIGTFLGLVFLREENRFTRIFGSCIIFAGIYILGAIA
jgi:uncharacterized membrane protein